MIRIRIPETWSPCLQLVAIPLLAALVLAACNDDDGLQPGPQDPALPALALTAVDTDITFIEPLAIAHAGDGSGRLFVVERRGVISAIDDVDDEAQATAFLDIQGLVYSVGSEQGLLGIAFAPGFTGSGHLYVHYTSVAGFEFGIQIADGDTIVSRFEVNGGVADPDSETLVLHVPQPLTNHNGGQLAFGPDDLLYVALGDGGGGGDPDGNAQNLNTLLGKLLRLDVEGGAPDYDVPANNPFAAPQAGRDEIWAYGLRNPWRFSFDRATGDLYIADVGQGRREEINHQPAASPGGENYGWDIVEGELCYPPAVNTCDRTGLTPPVAVIEHGTGDCAVIGGHVYRGGAFAALNGVYLYGDFCSGRIRGFRTGQAVAQAEILLETGMRISAFGEDEDGEVYIADYDSGRLYRIDPAP